MRERIYGFGLLLIGAMATYSLYHFIQEVPRRGEGPEHLLFGAIVFAVWMAGIALVVMGPGLLKPTEPPHH